MSASDSDDSDTNVVDRDANAVQQFMDITGCNQNLTETIMASHPNLDAALEYFYSAPPDAPKEEIPCTAEYSDEEAETAPAAEDLKGLEVSLTSWNIDGLDRANMTSRFKAVYYVLKRINPDFIFLQEVVKESATDYLPKLENDYNLYFSKPESRYFTAIMVNKQLEVINHEVIPFENTLMDRTLQIIEGRLGPLKVFLLNTHLESTAEYSQQRCEQFRQCMNKIREIITKNPDCLLYFGGDLNIRDKEIEQEASCIPKGVADAWMAAGCDIKHKYTFDMTQNDNKAVGNGRARCRFDRIFFSGPLNIGSFELDGKQRIRSSLCFPSDHFAVSCVFKA